MVKVGDVVEIAFNRATDEEIAKRPGVYQTEAYIGEVVSASYVDAYGVECAEVKVGGRRRKTPTEKLTVVDRARLAEFNNQIDKDAQTLAQAVANGDLPASVLTNSQGGS